MSTKSSTTTKKRTSKKPAAKTEELANKDVSALTGIVTSVIELTPAIAVGLINAALGNTSWQTDTDTDTVLTNAQVVAAIDAALGSTDWQTDTDTQLTPAQVVAAVDSIIGNTDWQTQGGGTSLTPAQIVAAIDGELGNTDWQVDTDTDTQLTPAQVVAAIDGELGNTDWQTDTDTDTDTQLTPAQVVAAVDGELGNTDWQTPGGGASSQFDLASGNVTVKGEYIGDAEPVLTNPSAGVYLLTVPADTRVISATIFGDNTTLNGSSEFVLQVDNSANGIQRSYTTAQYIANTGAAADKFLIGTNETESFPSANVTQLLFPGMNGYGSTGYRIVIA